MIEIVYYMLKGWLWDTIMYVNNVKFKNNQQNMMFDFFKSYSTGVLGGCLGFQG